MLMAALQIPWHLKLSQIKQESILDEFSKQRVIKIIYMFTKAASYPDLFGGGFYMNWTPFLMVCWQ